MHDKVVRRRRAVLAVLVLLSLFLLTAYFGEGTNGTLHGVQRGAMEVLAPIQEGANRAASSTASSFSGSTGRLRNFRTLLLVLIASRRSIRVPLPRNCLQNNYNLCTMKVQIPDAVRAEPAAAVAGGEP